MQPLITYICTRRNHQNRNIRSHGQWSWTNSVQVITNDQRNTMLTRWWCTLHERLVTASFSPRHGVQHPVSAAVDAGRTHPQHHSTAQNVCALADAYIYTHTFMSIVHSSCACTWVTGKTVWSLINTCHTHTLHRWILHSVERAKQISCLLYDTIQYKKDSCYVPSYRNLSWQSYWTVML